MNATELHECWRVALDQLELTMDLQEAYLEGDPTSTVYAPPPSVAARPELPPLPAALTERANRLLARNQALLVEVSMRSDSIRPSTPQRAPRAGAGSFVTTFDQKA
jgi:hypothetical protein